jgi:hypothetical protein
VLATIGLALADAGRLDEAGAVLLMLRPAADREMANDGPGAVVEAAIAFQRGEQKRAADGFARAADAYEGGHDPRDVVEALVGLVASTSDPDDRKVALRRLEDFCRSSGITLLPRERALIRAG